MESEEICNTEGEIEQRLLREISHCKVDLMGKIKELEAGVIAEAITL
jgi:hypothetical protein